MEKMTALRRIFSDHGMLIGTTSSYMAGIRIQEHQERAPGANEEPEDEPEDDSEPVLGDPAGALFVVNLAAKFRASQTIIMEL